MVSSGRNDQAGNDEAFYVVSRGDFSGSKADETTGEWVDISTTVGGAAIPPAQSQPGPDIIPTSPANASSMEAGPSNSPPQKGKGKGKVSVTDFCRTLPTSTSTATAPAKRLPIENPDHIQQRGNITLVLQEEEARRREDEERSKLWSAADETIRPPPDLPPGAVWAAPSHPERWFPSRENIEAVDGVELGTIIPPLIRFSRRRMSFTPEEKERMAHPDFPTRPEDFEWMMYKELGFMEREGELQASNMMEYMSPPKEPYPFEQAPDDGAGAGSRDGSAQAKANGS